MQSNAIRVEINENAAKNGVVFNGSSVSLGESVAVGVANATAVFNLVTEGKHAGRVRVTTNYTDTRRGTPEISHHHLQQGRRYLYLPWKTEPDDLEIAGEHVSLRTFMDYKEQEAEDEAVRTARQNLLDRVRSSKG